MPFEKGHKKIGGRKKGTPNKATREWNELTEAITTDHAERFNDILSGMNDERFIDTYIKVLEYFKPKQNRVDNVSSDGSMTPQKELTESEKQSIIDDIKKGIDELKQY